MPKFARNSNVKSTSLTDRLNFAIAVCWNSKKPVTRQDLVNAYMNNPKFAGRSAASIRSSADWDFSSLTKTGMFDLVKVPGKKFAAVSAVVLKPKYRKMSKAPEVAIYPGMPTPTGRGHWGCPNLIPGFSLTGLAEKMGLSYTTVRSAIKRPDLISVGTRRRILKAIKDNGGDLSKVTLVKPNRTKKVVKPAKVDTWKVIPEKDVMPGDTVIQSKEGHMIFMRAL